MSKCSLNMKEEGQEEAEAENGEEEKSCTKNAEDEAESCKRETVVVDCVSIQRDSEHEKDKEQEQGGADLMNQRGSNQQRLEAPENPSSTTDQITDQIKNYFDSRETFKQSGECSESHKTGSPDPHDSENIEQQQPLLKQSAEREASASVESGRDSGKKSSKTGAKDNKPSSGIMKHGGEASGRMKAKYEQLTDDNDNNSSTSSSSSSWKKKVAGKLNKSSQDKMTSDAEKLKRLQQCNNASQPPPLQSLRHVDGKSVDLMRLSGGKSSAAATKESSAAAAALLRRSVDYAASAAATTDAKDSPLLLDALQPLTTTGDSAAATKKKSYDSQQQQPPQSSQLASLTGDSTPAGGGGGKKKKEKEKKGSAGADAELILPKILKHRRLENSVSDLSMVGHQGAPSGPASTIHASQSNCPSQIVKNSSFRDFMILLYIFGSSFVKKIQLFTKMNIKNKWFLFALFCFIAMSVYYNSFIGGMLSAGIIAALVNGLVDFVFAPKFAPGLPKHLQDISKTMYVQDVRDRTINIIDNIGKNEYTLKTVGFISMEFDASRPKLVTNLDSVEIVLMDGVLTLIHLRDNLKKYIDCFDPVFASILENDQFSVAIEDYRIYNTAKTKLDRTYQRSTPICIEYKYQINSSSLSEGDTTKSNDDRSSTKNKPPQSNNFSRIDCRLRKFYIYFQSTFDKYNWMNYLQQASCGINPSFGLQNIMDLKINATEDVKFSSESMGHQFKNIIDYMTFVESSLNLKYLQRPKQVLGSIDIQDSFLPADVYPSAFVLTVFINRLFWEIAHQKYFHDFASKIITNQLQKFILPDYISAPALKKFDFGKNAPKVTDMRHPFLDNQGLWFYVDIECKHGSSISCSSIFNLQQLLLKSKNDKEGKKGKNENTDSVFTDAEKISIDEILDIDYDILADDNDQENVQSTESDQQSQKKKKAPKISPSVQYKDIGSTTNVTAGGKIFKFIERASKNSLVQKITNLKSVNKRINNISKTEISMNIELEHLKGTFVLLIPPPPSQLLWYSFTPSTKLDLKIEYLYGSKELSVPMKKRMSVWIKNNIDIIFRKILTLPNMECILMNYDTFLQEKISFPKTPPPQAGKQQPNTSQQNRPPIPPPQFTPQSKNFGNKDYQNQGITISFTENLDEDNKKS